MQAPDRFHGLLIVDKPAGWTSHDVVARIRRLTRQRSVGHAGTLDPAATGVLPVAVGSATRALEYLSDASKTYLAEITFGVETDTLDVDGRVTAIENPPPLHQDTLRSMLDSFSGQFEQIPPLYSAIKIGGQPMYRLARAGIPVLVHPRQVTIHEIRLVTWHYPVASICIDCSKGFYVRSFARDLGQRAGTIAYLSNLVRLRVGQFSIEDAWTLPDLDAANLEDEWERIAIHPDATASDLPAVIIDAARRPAWRNGLISTLPESRQQETVRVYDSGGQWVGIGEIIASNDRSVLRPRKVVDWSV